MSDAFVHALERRVLFAGAELVRDIKLGTGSPSTWQNFVAHGSTLYFSVDDGSIGRETWLSNGTPGSTSPIDIQLGSGSSQPTEVTEAGGQLWFTANKTPSFNDRIVWRLDGLTAIPTDARDAFGFTSYRGLVYFGGYHKDTINTIGHELYRMSPEGSSIELVKDIRSGSSFPSYMKATSEDYLVFAAETPFSGNELLFSNGTPESSSSNVHTTIYDIKYPSGSSSPLPGTRPRPFAEAGGRLYASAHDDNDEGGDMGRELLVTLASRTDVWHVLDLNPGPGHSSPDFMTPVGDRLFFTASSDGVLRTLWVAEGASTVTRLNTRNVQGGPAVVGETVYFAAGVDLYKTDGTVGGTQLVKAGVAYGPPVAVGGLVYFVGNTPGAGFVLWQSDGTDAGTVRVPDGNPGYSSPSNLINVGGTLYFTAFHPTYGTELWKYTPNVVPPPPTVTSIAVNSGAAQRSQVKQLTVTFDQAVTLQNGAFKLVRFNTGGSGANNGTAPTDASDVLITPSSTDGGRTWSITFVGTGPFMELSNTGVPTGSLVDGIYTLLVDPAKVSAGGVAMTSPGSLTFHRLFGDAQGNKTVNNADYGAFRTTLSKTTGQAGFDAAFDFDNNGVVNNADFGQLRNRLQKVFDY